MTEAEDKPVINVKTGKKPVESKSDLNEFRLMPEYTQRYVQVVLMRKLHLEMKGVHEKLDKILASVPFRGAGC